MATDISNKPTRKSRGILRDSSFRVRILVLVFLLLACVALTFTQLGFARVDLGGGYPAYVVLLLLPIALAALLLGVLHGFLVGVFAGVVLNLHSVWMPLDYYEMSFVTPASSIVLLGFCGLLLGLLFMFVLRNNPPNVRRVIYLAICCVFISVLFSLIFVVCAMFLTILETMYEIAPDISREQISGQFYDYIMGMLLRLGDVGLQIIFDAVLMVVTCSLADAIARKMMSLKGNVGLRSTFAGWMTVAVLIVFMVTTGFSFVAITQGTLANAARDMNGEIEYISTQLTEGGKRSESLMRFLDGQGLGLDKLSLEQVQKLSDSISLDTLLDGYTVQSDGTVLVLFSTASLAEMSSGETAGADVSSGAADVSGSVSSAQAETSAGSSSAGASDGSTTAAPTSAEDAIKEYGGKYLVMQSDDERFKLGEPIETLARSSFANAIDKSIETGEMQRIVYDDVPPGELSEALAAGRTVRSHIAYITAKRVDNQVVMVMKTASQVFADRGSVMLWTTLSAFALLLALFIMVFQLLERVIVRRINETNAVLAEIGEGDLNARVDIRDTREFSSLSDGINSTVGALKGWISEAETRMSAELATAKAIQESALPRIFPPFPDIAKFDVYASMHAAKEVGGDFYDFFLIGDNVGADEGKLAFIVADVSGKGVPAALFMMKAKTQIRDYLESGMEPGEAVENANRQLCDGNDAGMFVTAWVGVLDYGTGHVDFVNAGHNPPMVWQQGAWRWIHDKSGLPLGLFDGFPYESFSIECEIGDQFLLYSDGVTEAMNVEGELYGEDRLEQLLNANFEKHPRMLVDAVRSDVAQHARGAEQSDDITILALEVGVPPEVTATLVLPAEVGQLSRVNDFIHTELDRRLCPLRAQSQLDIAVEELFVNVCHYAYPEATPENPGVVRVSYTYSADPPSITVYISDDGIPYNPLEKPDAVTPDDVMDVPIGGLGILMAKRSVNEMAYERIDGSNVVSIVKKW